MFLNGVLMGERLFGGDSHYQIIVLPHFQITTFSNYQINTLRLSSVHRIITLSNYHIINYHILLLLAAKIH
jgi:hypothetical protein